MRRTHALCRGWRFAPRFSESFTGPDSDISSWDSVEIPHTNIELPYNGFDETLCQFQSTYALDFSLDEKVGEEPAFADIPPTASAASEKRHFLDFDAVMSACEVWVNGSRAGGHSGGFTPFSLEITDLVREGEPNRLVVAVDSTEDPDIPPFGGVLDFLCYGGIYRPVRLRSQGALFLSDVWLRGLDILADRKGLDIHASVDYGGGNGRVGAGLAPSASFALRARLLREGNPVAESLETPLRGKTTILELRNLRGIRLWEPDDPELYQVDVELLRDGRAEDRLGIPFGFRTAEFRPEGFFLNGKRLFLRGLNRHQSYPYVGFAMPARVQKREALFLKRELGLNLVRTSHYPQSPAFLDACDEIGLLVFEELPGWQHVGEAVWKAKALSALGEMILRDRSRPSIVLWGVRVNESKDDSAFYRDTNALARRLDPDRQTGGVRYLEKSELLEDVYTFNDFVHAGGRIALKSPRRVSGGKRVPYLVTEHNGHMYPTKRFDNEERLAEHARRHARVLDAAMGDPSISGAIGWCAFDYNTHKDFGSGDRICYHGVCDMFRVPKYAAAVYASQLDPSVRPVLEAASLFAKGERSGARLLPIEVWTNCDEVILYRGAERVGVFRPERKSWPHLEHPPVVLGDLIGERLDDSGFSAGDRRIIRRVSARIMERGAAGLSLADKIPFGYLMLKNRLGYAAAEAIFSTYGMAWGAKDETFELVGMVAGREAIRRRYGPDSRFARLDVSSDDPSLSSREPDATRVLFRALDQYGNIFPFASGCVRIALAGPGRFIGPRSPALVGGCVATWVFGTDSPGCIEISAQCDGLEPAGIRIDVT